MPIYDYRCDHCGHVFSQVQSFKDDALTTCPSCGRRPRRVMTAPAIVFKGSGWYKTDSRTAPASAGEEKGKAPDKGGEGAAGTGTSPGTKPPGTKAAEAKPEKGTAAAREAAS